MSIFNIFGRISLDSTDFNAGMKKAESAVAGFGKMAARYFTAGAIGYGLTSLARNAYNTAGQIADLADQMKITTDEVQMLQAAAIEAGVEFGVFESAIQKVNKAKADAAAGDEKAIELLRKFGATSKTGALDILRAAGREGGANAFELLGVKAGKLLTILTQIQQLGPTDLISEGTARTLDDVGTKLEKINRQLKVAAANVLGSASPQIDFWSRAIEEGSKIDAAGGSFALTRGILMAMVDGIGDRATNKRYEALPLPIKDVIESASETKADKRRAELMASANDPFNLGKFTSSSQNSRASIGGFFIGADATARMDVQKQQLAKQTMMADRMDKIEKQLAKIVD